MARLAAPLRYLGRLCDANDAGVEAHLVLALLLLIVFLGLSIWDVVQCGHPFQPGTFAIAAGSLLGGVGGANWCTAQSRQTQQQNPQPQNKGDPP